MMKTNKAELIKIIQNEFAIVVSGLQIINDEHNYKERGKHGIPNQEYEDKVKQIVNDIGKIVMKKIVYEKVLADTWKGHFFKKDNLLKKANTILQDLVKVDKPNRNGG